MAHEEPRLQHEESRLQVYGIASKYMLKRALEIIHPAHMEAEAECYMRSVYKNGDDIFKRALARARVYGVDVPHDPEHYDGSTFLFHGIGNMLNIYLIPSV